jgi:glycerate kinase
MSRGGDRLVKKVSGAGGGARATRVRNRRQTRGARPLVIEAAEVVGITDPDAMNVPVGARATQGIGELIRALLDLGVRDS